MKSCVTAEIRPRSDWEAVDLGFAMVRRDFWRCLIVWWMAMGIPCVLGGVVLWNYPAVFLILFWWLKPAGSRMVLLQVSRRLFGEQPSWKAIWRELPKAWSRRFGYRFFVARFSPWLPVTLAVEDLEGLRGPAYKQRCKQVVRRGESVIMWLYLLSELASAWIAIGIFLLIIALTPQGQEGWLQQAIESWDPEIPYQIPVILTRIVAGCAMLSISFVDLFLIGAGFGIYINNRTWLEGWDVELAFKRLAQRLGKVAIILVSLLMICPSARAEEVVKTPTQVITEVKADEAFKVHKVKEKVPKSSPSKSSTSLPPDLLRALGKIFLVSAIALVVGFIGWLFWKFRHVFMRAGSGVKEERLTSSARVVMGMEISPETLPSDIPSAAWQLWQQGKAQEAMSLLYRGSISRVMELGRLEIQESDTEGDCMRRVEEVGASVFPDYFRGITGTWIRMAYAGISPAEAEMQRLCQQWPFGGRRAS
ncbi:MAG: hypothetical protein HC767_10925 [Akkermansiaceae bacterium]|nr:hypothetical protein [Akkermansiaceae bacterium]